MLPLMLMMAATLAGASPDGSKTSASPAQATATNADAANPMKDPDRVICRTEEVTGSRFEQRICRTRSEWAAQERSTDRYKHIIDDSQGLAGHPSGPFGQ